MSLGLLRALFITDPLIVLATAAFGTVNLIAALFNASEEKQIDIARAWSRRLLRITGVKVTVHGLEHIDAAGAYVFVANHVSYMDTPVIFANIPAQFRFLARTELFKIPFIGTHLKRAGHIPVPLEAKAFLRTLTEAGRLVRERGISLLIFPEGGRSETGELQEFKDGAAYLAIKAGAPVVPLGLIGMYQILPMHSIHMRPGHV
ncbi:MAG TPA: lysophospholipid acyltransferase family protein, partial [Bryobacteraceae bacterium]|nr:lysophospholipid acyltransferase family protein [Bryobacteraceae bacterium]